MKEVRAHVQSVCITFKLKTFFVVTGIIPEKSLKKPKEYRAKEVQKGAQKMKEFNRINRRIGS